MQDTFDGESLYDAMGIENRVNFENMSESDSEGNSEIVSKDYDVACILVAPVESNPLTLQALRLYVAEGIDNGELDEDEFPEEYIDILKNTPIDEPITIEAISDEKLREWDKIRYTRGSRNLLDVINEEV